MNVVYRSKTILYVNCRGRQLGPRSATTRSHTPARDPGRPQTTPLDWDTVLPGQRPARPVHISFCGRPRTELGQRSRSFWAMWTGLVSPGDKETYVFTYSKHTGKNLRDISNSLSKDGEFVTWPRLWWCALEQGTLLLIAPPLPRSGGYLIL